MSVVTRLRLAQAPDRLSELVRKIRQRLASLVGDDHEILQPDAAVALPVAAGLERDHVAGLQRVGRAAEPRALVDLETDAVAEPVEEAVAQHGAGLLGELRRQAGLDVGRTRGLVDRAAVGARADHRVDPPQRLARELPVAGELLIRLAAAGHERPRHVRPAARGLVARPDVDDHRLAIAQRAVTGLVTRGALAAGRDDHVVGQLAAALLAGRLHGDADVLGRRAAGADHARGDGHRGVRGALGAADAVELGAALAAA